MRRKFSFEEGEENDVDLTPMIDIVFIMLIFFIVTASFVKEAGIDVNRPGAVTAERKEKAELLGKIEAELWRRKEETPIATATLGVSELKALLEKLQQGGAIEETA